MAKIDDVAKKLGAKVEQGRGARLIVGAPKLAQGLKKPDASNDS